MPKPTSISPSYESRSMNVRPRDCALAVALPLTRDRFLSGLREPERYDYAPYVRSLYPFGGAANDFYWSVIYEPFATAMARRCEAVERLGVAVVAPAPLADLESLMQSYSVVTLVSHWRFRAVKPDDILDAGAVAARLLNPETQLQHAFRRELERRNPLLFTARHQLIDSATLAAVFNDLLREEHAKYAS